MILDATAGNRHIWKYKDSENIIYIDMERQLQISPTLFCDHACTPFLSKLFDSIFYDPPHSWGKKSHYYAYPRSTPEYVEKYKDKSIPRYYGWDKFKNRGALISGVFLAQKEFYRILKDEGLLWLKWNEISIPLNKIMTIFTEWRVLLKLFIKAPSQTAGKTQTYWVCMEKKKSSTMQSFF